MLSKLRPVTEYAAARNNAIRLRRESGCTGFPNSRMSPDWRVSFTCEGEDVLVVIERGDGHLVLRQRPGLIRADDGGGSQSLNGRQASNESMTPDHFRDAKSQRDGHDGRKSFGNRRDGQADRGQKHETERLSPQNSQNKHDGHNAQ